MAQPYAVDIVFQTQGGDKLKAATAQANKTEQAVQKLNGRLRDSKGRFASTGAAAQQAATGINATGRAAATASGNIQRLGVAFRTTFAPLTAIIGTIALFSKSLTLMGERDADLKTLSNGLRDLVDNSENAARALEQQADALGKATLFDQEDFTAAFKLFTSFKTIGVDSYGRVAEAAADMAQVLGQAPKDAALQLAKALEAPDVGLTALQRSGTRFSDSQKEVIKGLVKSGKLLEAQDLILKEIEKQYSGAARAAGQQGFAGAMDTLGENFRDFQENLGRTLEPILVPFINGLSEVFKAAIKIQPAFEAFLGSLGKIGAAMKPVIDAVGLGSFSLSEFADSFVFAYKVVAVVVNDIAYVVGQLANEIAKIIKGITQGIADFFGKVLPNNSASGLSALVKNFANAIRAIRQLWANLINAVPPLMLAKLFGIDVGQIVTSPIGGIADGIEGAFQYGASVISRAQAMDFGGRGDTDFTARRISGTPTPDDGKGKGKGKGKGGADKAAREAELAAKQLKAAQDRVFAAEQLLAKQQELSKVQEIELQRDQEIAKVQREYSDLLSKVKSIEEENALIKARGLEIDAAKLEAEKAIQALREGALSNIDEEIKLQQAKLAGKEEEYQLQKKINDLVKAGGGSITKGEATARVNTLNQLKQQTEAQDKAKSSAEALAGSISSALTDSLRGLIDGSMSAEEALSNAFKKIGDAFIDMAMQMIQEWIKMQIMGLVGSFFGGAPGGGFGAGAFNLSGGQFGAFAEGGYVTGPTRALIGEGGTNEYVIPEDKMNSAMQRYSAGTRGAAVLEGPGTSEADGDYAMAEAPISITTGPVMQFNDKNYVTQEEFVVGVRNAAKQGEARTLARLRNSPSARRKIGL